ncbi:MAG: cytidine deaminase [Deltaproteobacteria bacterium]|nr:cytidine deaminase [Deltaproteobacteria bacterium]
MTARKAARRKSGRGAKRNPNLPSARKPSSRSKNQGPEELSQFSEMPANPEIVIGIAAAVGTPLELFENFLSEQLSEFGYETVVLRLSRYTREFRLSTRMPLASAREATRIDAMMNRGNEARSVTGRNDILALSAIADIRVKRARDADDRALPGKAFVLRQLKHPEEVHLLRDTYGSGFHLFGLYCPRDRRERHLRERGANVSEVRRLIDRDEHEASGSGQHLRDTFHMADVFFEVGDKHDDVRRELSRFLQLLFGMGVIAPTQHEFGMFQAYAASLRSAQLGRQVGAAIISEHGDILSVGTNEVPRCGGGLYWDHDDHDKRDHKLGYDSSDKAKEEVVTEIAERIHSNWENETKASKQRFITELLSKLRSTRITSLTEFGRAVHAEAEAILSAARIGASPRGGILYCTTFPCHVCARHIVAAGIREVFYIEPYPKSKAFDLHADSISIETRVSNRVLFRPFVGVAPRRFERLFSMVSAEGREIKRKDDKGMVNSTETGLRLKFPYFSALGNEKRVAAQLEGLTKDQGGSNG